MRFFLGIKILENQLVTLSVLKEEKMTHFIDKIEAIKHFQCYIIQLLQVR